MSDKAPRVSVIVPAYNSERYILDSVESVLRQTLSDFEVIVVNDGSTDATKAVVTGLSDRRLRIIDLDRNHGLAGARNIGWREARGHYVAWLDSDDVSAPTRLARQVAFLDKHPAVGICGTWVRTFGSGPSTVWRYPRRPEVVRAQLLFDDPLATSSVMMRRGFDSSQWSGFVEDFAPAEDYDAWERLSRGCQVANVPRVLTHYRIHDQQISTLRRERQRAAIEGIQRRQLLRLGLEPSPAEWVLHNLVGASWGSGLGSHELAEAEDWLHRLRTANRATRVYEERAFDSVVGQRVRIIRNAVAPNRVRRLAIRVHTLTH